MRVHRILFSAVIALTSLGAAAPAGAAGEQILPWTPQTWAEVAKLPDWSGVWVPDVRDQDARIKTDPTPWNAAAAKKIDDMNAQEDAGDPKGLFYDCLPEAMPSWMLITHNALEFTFTPGRVTMLGEADGNRLRRIYTDGRPHPDDPDLTFHGHSIGHWEGQALEIDTVGILPETYLAISEAVGLPNNGDMHIIERIHLAGARLLLPQHPHDHVRVGPLELLDHAFDRDGLGEVEHGEGVVGDRRSRCPGHDEAQCDAGGL